MKPPAPRVFDANPLVEEGERVGLHGHHLCRQLRISGSVLADLRARGLTVDQADRLANRLGKHPGELWPTWWSLPELDDVDDIDEDLVLEEGAIAA